MTFFSGETLHQLLLSWHFEIAISLGLITFYKNPLQERKTRIIFGYRRRGSLGKLHLLRYGLDKGYVSLTNTDTTNQTWVQLSEWYKRSDWIARFARDSHCHLCTVITWCPTAHRVLRIEQGLALWQLWSQAGCATLNQ